MKDWEERLEDLTRRLEAWFDEVETTANRLAKERGLKSWRKRPSPAQAEELYREARQEAGEGILEEISSFFTALAETFLEGLPQVRALIRARVGSHPILFELLWSYIQESADLVRSSADGERLKLTLAAIAIDDSRIERTQLDEQLGRLWHNALRVGLDPRPIFAEVGEVANRGMGGGGAELAELLCNYEDSLHYRRAVAPALADEGLLHA